MPLLSIAPIGGLCNRMRALNAALSLAADIDSSVELVWCRDRTLNCRFAELFLPPVGVSRLVEIDLHTWWGRSIKRVLVTVRSGHGKQLYSQSQIVSALEAGRKLTAEFSGKNVFVETGSVFHSVGGYDKFVPVPELAKIVNGYRARLDGAVGVHLRRTDNEKSSRYSPLDGFVARMSKLLAEGSCEKFFLASDSPDEANQLHAIFPGRIVSHPKASYDRDDADAIKDALVDLYCLAQCRMIIGSYWSSFSEVAAAVGQKELMVIKSPD